MLTPDAIAAIARCLAERAGLELPAWVIEARASARITAIGCAPAEYAALIDSGRGAGELATLIEAVRVGESRLFRHRPQIEVLAGVVAPALRARGRRAIRVWSAGCAAGEEPYTLAIVLSRALPDCALSIAATDVSGEALARARAASYPRTALDHVPERYRDAFIDDGAEIRVAPDIAARVRFERANLTTDPAPRDCDLVWCRNVLIYFTAEARRKAIERLVAATVPGGFVFVGYSESLRDVGELDALRASDTVYYVRRSEPAPRARPPTLPGVLAAPEPVTDRGSAPVAGATAPMADRRSAPNVAAIAPAADRTPPPIVTDRRSVPNAAANARAADRRSAPIPTANDRAPPAATGHRSAPIPAAATDDSTPPPTLAARHSVPPVTADPAPSGAFLSNPAEDAVIALRGQPAAAELAAEISARLAQPGLRTLSIDLDGAELLDDDLVRVLRRARAAAWTAQIVLEVNATRPGVVRWLTRHGFGEDEATHVERDTGRRS